MSKDMEITLAQIRKAIPDHCFVKSESRFLVSVGNAVSLCLVLAYLAHNFIPLCWAATPLWILYIALNGTAAFGVWILGHECGHGAFSNNKYLNDFLGFILHESILVPYFSWQHSHSVHHAKTNHMTEGESHVPVTVDSKNGKLYMKLRSILGHESFAILQIFTFGAVGFPSYLLAGLSGGPARGFTSHFFVPNQLFPSRLLMKVHASTLGLLFMGFLLYKWAMYTSFAHMFVLYLAPYLVTNAWLTFITFLQHTEADVPHYDHRSWTWLKGALCTIDRNYPLWIDALHFEIGTTHVLHHIFADIPHYHAHEATINLKKLIGEYYRYDPKNVLTSLFKISQLAAVEHRGNGVFKYVE